MFSQNVFGLEPATVRVREVRIGRAERRAARRRARDREPLIEDLLECDPQDTGRDPDTNVSVNVSVASPSRAGTPTTTNDVSDQTHTQESEGTTVTAPQPPSEELAALAAVQASPYTTFQQLSFAPNFPLASISDEFIIPPTYREFLQYRAEHEPAPAGENDLSQVQFSPPGLPVPVTLPPSKWYYRDPKGIVHGQYSNDFVVTVFLTAPYRSVENAVDAGLVQRWIVASGSSRETGRGRRIYSPQRVTTAMCRSNTTFWAFYASDCFTTNHTHRRRSAVAEADITVGSTLSLWAARIILLLSWWTQYNDC